MQSRIVRDGIQLTDITDRFFSSAASIQTGQLVKDDDFTLLESVGALEIGDPKMDSGALGPGEDLEDDFEPSQPLSAAQVIWIIDELMCREVSWHQGYPLSQTLFTAIHLDRILWPDPKQISEAHFIRDGTASPHHQLLRAYCLGLIKCCDLALAMITSQHYYEEEDFATQIFNREMLRSFTTDNIMAEMKLVHVESPALMDRLNFRIAFLGMLSDCGAGRPPQPINLNSTAEGEPIPEAFSIKIQRRVASSVPPRPMVACERNEAFVFMQRLLQDTSAAFEILNVSNASDLYAAFWTFVSQTPCVYVRSLVQSFLNLDDKMAGTPLYDLILDDLQNLVPNMILDREHAQVETPTDPRFQIYRQISQFINKVGPPFQNQFRSFALNRSRVRRNLCHAAIEWDNIQADAEEVDGYLQTLTNEKPLPYGDELAYSYPLSSWVYHYKLLQLRLVIQVGFELEIYEASEYVDIYWYLSHISSLHLSHLERISFFIKEQKALKLLYRHFTILKATDTLASALQRVFEVLERHKVKGMTYSTDELRYELRMRPFQQLSVPEPLTHAEMKRISSLHTLSDAEVLSQATRLASISKKAWEEVLRDKWHSGPLLGVCEVTEREWMKNIKDCMKACIGTSIALTALTRAVQLGKMDMVNVTVPAADSATRLHRWWTVPVIS